ncbi:MAG TPA: arylesterase [Planctomycetota bacterium]|nr:arylesterase [Planctomycetota bacterium]
MRLVLLLLLMTTPVVLPAATIVCLGDSLTAGQGVDEDQAFPAVVQRLARADGLDWTVSNAGVSGDTSAGGVRRVAWLIKGKPDWVFVALGANDGLRGQPVTATRDNLSAIAEKFRAAGVQVAFAGMRLPTNYGEDYRTAFTALFPQIAEDKKIPLMPFLLDGVGGIPALNQADGIHPTVEGQEQIARNVYAFLKPLVDAGKSVEAAK